MRVPPAIILVFAILAPVFACPIVVGLAAAGESSSTTIEKTTSFSAERARKVDRMQGVTRILRSSQVALPANVRPPIACDALFSIVGVPMPERLYGRCAA
jgi:hypothetical protein